MMRIYAVSDLHGNLPDIPKCDLLLLGGDYCPVRDPEKERSFIQGPFKEWLRHINARHIVGIAGNHDFIFQREPDIANSLPWIYLQDRVIDLEGVKIYGTPWTPTYYYWAFQRREHELERIFADIPSGLDILLSHGPAYKHLDESNNYYCGSHALLDAIKRARPDSVVCGHIHEGRGIMNDDDIRFYNVSYCNSRLEPVYNPVNITLRIPELEVIEGETE